MSQLSALQHVTARATRRRDITYVVQGVSRVPTATRETLPPSIVVVLPVQDTIEYSSSRAGSQIEPPNPFSTWSGDRCPAGVIPARQAVSPPGAVASLATIAAFVKAAEIVSALSGIGVVYAQVFAPGKPKPLPRKVLQRNPKGNEIDCGHFSDRWFWPAGRFNTARTPPLSDLSS